MAIRNQKPRADSPPPILPLPVLPIAKAVPPPRIVGILAIVYVALILLGLVAFKSPKALPGGYEMSLPRCVFWPVNAVTATGFQASVGRPNDLEWHVQVVFFLLTLGGAYINLVIGSIAVVRILRLPYSIRRIMVAATICMLVPLLIGAVLLNHDPSGAPLTGMAGGASEGLAAFVNCGQFVGHLHASTDWQTFLILMPLVVLGGLGLPVLLELFDLAFKQRRPSRHSATVLALTAGLFLLFFALFLIVQLGAASWKSGNTTNAEEQRARAADWTHAQDIVASSCVASINTRTAGLPFEEVLVFPRAMQWLMMVAMAIGASPAGTGGGLKNTTILEVVRGTMRTLRGESPGRLFGIALTAVAAYAGIAFFAILLLLGIEAQMPPDRIVFMTISALSNVGLSHDLISLSSRGTYLISLVMVAGRALPLLILWTVAARPEKVEIAIG